jgi:hypothetical protein
MKRQSLYLVCILCAALLSLSANAETITITIDSIEYECYTESCTATVKGGNKSADSLIIHNQIEDEGKIYTVTAIGHSAFSKNTKLKSIIIPEGITSIEYAAFYNCSHIVSITSYATQVPVCLQSAFGSGTKSETIVYVPKETIDAYKTADGWKDFSVFKGIDPTGICSVNASEAVEVMRYTSDGQIITAPQYGINIVKMNNGTVKKVLVK